MIPLLRVISVTVIKDADMDYFQRRILHGKYVFAFVEHSKSRAHKGNIVMLAVGDLLREGEE